MWPFSAPKPVPVIIIRNVLGEEIPPLLPISCLRVLTSVRVRFGKRTTAEKLYPTKAAGIPLASRNCPGYTEFPHLVLQRSTFES